MERHRHQLEVQTAFREQGARLQATYDKKQKAEYDMAKRWVRHGPDFTASTTVYVYSFGGGEGVGRVCRFCYRDGGSKCGCGALIGLVCSELCRCGCRETEIKQLQGWKSTVDNLVDKFQELISAREQRQQQQAAALAAAAGDSEAGGVEVRVRWWSWCWRCRCWPGANGGLSSAANMRMYVDWLCKLYGRRGSHQWCHKPQGCCAVCACRQWRATLRRPLAASPRSSMCS